MSDPKFPPGPWLKEGEDFIFQLNENGHNSFVISVNRGCWCPDCRKLPPDIEAITNLAKAAPELFEALEGVIETLKHHLPGDLLKKQTSAIAKALGG